MITLKGQHYDMISAKCVRQKMDLIKLSVASVADETMIHSIS